MRYQVYGTWYDTDKAKLIGVHESGEGAEYGYQALYRTRTGKYFVHVSGNVPEFDDVKRRKKGDKIILVSYDKAEKWARDHMTADEFLCYFGEHPNDGKEGRVVVTLRLKRKQYLKVKREADKRGLFMNEYIELLLPGYED